MKDHLGSVRATVNSSGDVVSAQDYACPPWRDSWGYLLQDRTFDSDDSKFKFTGKERDVESDYDYFGARYYDARIGRWGQTEPLYNKYIDLSPYSYVAGNPLVFRDKDGREIIILGDDAKKVVKELRKNTNLKYKFDKTTGKLTITGKAKTKLEELLLEASNSEKITVKLTTTRNNSPENWVVGAFLGSSIENNKVVASQSFNVKFANVWEKAGGSNVGLSATHEIVEAFIGGVYFPGEKISDSDGHSYGWSHYLTVLAEGAEGNSQYYPQKIFYPATNEYFYLNEKEKIYYPIK